MPDKIIRHLHLVKKVYPNMMLIPPRILWVAIQTILHQKNQVSNIRSLSDQTSDILVNFAGCKF